MGNPHVVEALYRAWVDRQTGWLTCTAQGRETKIPLREGSVVGTSLGAGFGWQGTVPALVQNGRLALTQLDALWARGEAAATDSDTLDELGIVPAEAESARVLASIRETVRAAESVRFDSGDVGSGELVSGARVVREAWSTIAGSQTEPAFFRAQDLNGLARWEPTSDDETWLQDFLEWKQPVDATPQQLALLEVLTRSGAFESIPAVEMRQRREEERLEQERIEAERQEAERLERARLEEERIAAERAEAERIAAEKAEAERLENERLAAEAARLEEERRAEAERLENERLAAEAARLEEERRAEAERLENERLAAEAARLEEERIAAEKAEAERIEEERVAAEKAEAERVENERLEAEAARLEEERIAAEKAEAERIENERLADEAARLEEERLAAEAARLEAERLAAEKAEAERIENERLAAEAARLEEERLAAEKAEAERIESERRLEEERLAAEKAESERIESERRFEEERIAAEKAEAERIENERLAAEAARLEEERLAAAKTEAERVENERLAAEAARLEEERIAAEKAEAERVENERLAAEAARLEEERIAAEKVEAERIENERLAAEAARLEEERIAAEKVEAERIENERLAAEAARLEEERIAAEKAEVERLAELARIEEERIAAEKAEAERLEEERLAAERAEAARIAEAAWFEEERLANERAESERLENERVEAARAEEERVAAERAEAARIAEAAWFEEERLANERAETERLENERVAAETARREEERLVAERAQQEREEEERRDAESRAQVFEAARVRHEEEKKRREQEDADRLASEELRRAAEAADAEEESEAVRRQQQLRAAEDARDHDDAADHEEEERLLAAAQAARVKVEAERSRSGLHPIPAQLAAAPQPAKNDQHSLLERMNAALRQATYVGPAPTSRPREEKTDPHIVAVQPAEPSRKPLMLGGQQDSQGADLWSVAQPSSLNAPAPGVQSFEEALRRVDSSLEALMGPAGSDAEQPLIEPIIEAEVVSTAPAANVGARLDEIEQNTATDSAEAARLRRQRLLKRAMENLSSMPSSSGSGINSSGSGITSSGSGIAAPPPSAPSVPVPSAAEQQLAAQIEARFAQLSRRDPFLTLGLSQSATRDQVKSAFLSLAKTFHPDRLPPSLPHLAQKMSAVFEGIRESYETLFDDQKRAAYVAAQQARAANAPDPVQAQQASDLSKMAEVYFKKRDYRQAEAHFARSHAIDKGASSLAAQGWAIYMDPSRKAEAPAARQLMQKALTIDANNDRAHYQLGVIARVEGDMDRAERHFREAVRFNSKHLEANQELRLIEMRKKKAETSPKKGGGFFG